MDKKNRKDLKNRYKLEENQKSFENLINSDFAWVGDFVKVEMGIALPGINKEEIEAANNGFELSQRIYLKILETARMSNNFKSVWGRQTEETIDALSKFLQAVYYPYLFESALAIGDIDKQFTYFSQLELSEVNRINTKLKLAYGLMDCPRMIALIEEAEKAQTFEALQEISKLYDPEEVDKKRLTFIKNHWQEFIIV